MNNNLDSKILQQKNNLEWQLAEANQTLNFYRNRLRMVLEAGGAGGGNKPPAQNPRPTRPRGVAPAGTNPAGIPPSVPVNPRPVTPTTPAEPPVWRPSFPGQQNPTSVPRNPLSNPNWQRTPPQQWQPGQGPWYNGSEQHYWRYMNQPGPGGGRVVPFPSGGQFWLLGGDGRVFVWHATGTPPRWVQAPAGNTPWGPIQGPGVPVTPPQGTDPSHVPLPGGGWGPPPPPYIPPPTRPLGPERPEYQGPGVIPNSPFIPPQPIPMPQNPQPTQPWWQPNIQPTTTISNLQAGMNMSSPQQMYEQYLIQATVKKLSEKRK